MVLGGDTGDGVKIVGEIIESGGGIGDSTGVSVSLGGGISLGGKKFRELCIGDSDNTGDRGKTAGRSIETCGGIDDDIVVLENSETKEEDVKKDESDYNNKRYTFENDDDDNGVAKRKNRTLREAARTMLVDSKLRTTFWAEVVSTACYVLNRVLVIKPHTKTPYELIHGKPPLIDFVKPFGCPVTILNTRDHLSKFDGKAYEEFFVGYFMVRKALRVFNKRTWIVEETLNIRFLENAPNVIGNGPD
ncbi:ribonuclease H-like domain-containing protein [Tanacetum coccineum]